MTQRVNRIETAVRNNGRYHKSDIVENNDVLFGGPLSVVGQNLALTHLKLDRVYFFCKSFELLNYLLYVFITKAYIIRHRDEKLRLFCS